jgi:cytochrome c
MICAAMFVVAPLASVAAQEATGDVEAGRRVANQCRACHTFEQGGPNRVGPNLHSVFGPPAGSIANFRYSPAMRQRADGGLVWNDENLRAYLRDPKAVVPNGTMAFPGLRNNEQQITDLLAFLRQNGAGAQ